MGSKANSDIALGDVRSTSYNAATANSKGYVGTIEDALAQIRAEPDEVRAPRAFDPQTFNLSSERAELLGFLGVLKPRDRLSGRQRYVRMPLEYVYPTHFSFLDEDLDRVEYGAPDQPEEPGFYTLAYAMKRWPHCFKSQP
jgi:hypothetical protein